MVLGQGQVVDCVIGHVEGSWMFGCCTLSVVAVIDCLGDYYGWWSPNVKSQPMQPFADVV
jgi:hypothetical protein